MDTAQRIQELTDIITQYETQYQWEKTLKKIREWLRTDFLASPKRGDVRINDEAQRDLWRRQRETVNKMGAKR